MCFVVQLSCFGGIIIQSQVITARIVEGTIPSVGKNATKKIGCSLSSESVWCSSQKTELTWMMSLADIISQRRAYYTVNVSIYTACH